MRTREEIGRGKKSDAGRNRMREEIGDGCLAAAGRFISGARLGKRQIILGGRKSCVIFAYYGLN